jgi:hypothetical protein
MADEWAEFAVKGVYVDVKSFRSAGGILCSGPWDGKCLQRHDNWRDRVANEERSGTVNQFLL